MKKPICSLRVLIFGTAALALAPASAQTIVQTVSNARYDDWNDAIWGSPAAVPTSGNDYQSASGLLIRTTELTNGSGPASTFAGGSLEIVDGSSFISKNRGTTSTVNGAFTLSGGTILAGPSGTGNHLGTLAASSFTVSGTSDIQLAENSGNYTISNNLTGSGHLYLSSNSTQNGSGDDDLIFAGISGYSGKITLGAASSGAWDTSFTGDLTLQLGTSNFTFLDTFTIVGTSVLQVNSGQTLTFDFGDLIDSNGTIAAGTYTDVSTLGSNFTGAGTITVIPEPSSAVLLGLASLGLVTLRRRRRG